MSTETETKTRTVEEIVEREFEGVLSVAFPILEVQNAAAGFTEAYRKTNARDWPVEWDRVEQDGIPRDFFEACLKVAETEIRLAEDPRA